MATPIQNDVPFTRTATLALIGIGASAFFGALIILVFADLFDPDAQVGANSYSKSAIGHAAAIELLDELDIDVMVSRRNPVDTEIATETVVLAEPSLTHLGDEFVEVVAEAPTLFLILPKRYGQRSALQPRWIEQQGLVGTTLPLGVLQKFSENSRLDRPEGEQEWQSHAFPDLVPELADPQLFSANNVIPLIEGDDGILLGRIERPQGPLYILSDPDLISNHGLADGDNAAIFALLMEYISLAGSLHWDETSHGFKISDSVWRTAFEPPLLSITIATCFASVILLLVTTYRFGAPLPAPEVRARGKSALVGALADLLSMQRHHNELMRRYLNYGLRDTIVRMNVPSRMTEAQSIDWIIDVGLSRGISRGIAETPMHIYDATKNNQLDNATLTRLIQKFYQWKMELLDGSKNS